MDYIKLTESLESLTKGARPQFDDDAARVRLVEAARAVSLRFENPFETYFRLIFLDMSVGLILAGVELGLWKRFSEKAPDSIPVSELAKELGILEDTLARILRFAATQHVVDEVGEDVYRANAITEYFITPRAESVVFLASSRCCRVGPAMPEFFSRYREEDPATFRPLPWNMANNTDLPVWQWLAENPREQNSFNDFMFVQTTGMASFLEKFDLEKYIQPGNDQSRFRFVDVGGGSGHISRAVLAKYPSLHGKIAVEDHNDAGTVTRADFAKEGLEMVPHDFFTPQPLKGANVYYMRNILHNWPTDKCKVILEHLRDALEPDSVILVDDIVVPPTGSHWYTTHMDMMMLTNLGALERTEAQFADLFESVGLQRSDLVRYNAYGPAIQVVTRK